MPQLDTSTWPISIMSMILTLFIVLQLKLSKFTHHPHPSEKSIKLLKCMTPWEKKWTKTYLLHSQSPH